ncbi:class I SAM-dependent methyltransferase [Cohnella thailandensis]|uniref:Class I SAM-dependent methyltransferase n=1 Tax=Cohnella thailandensis TaxID=557557 RepID=A0A841T2F2_9BACL|nr:class I SAM-dependent methyltransferase [Cohnella thailandensis]MBB6638324.1 class I SAM-dependent methyltransferase [Cohnella thailandensis]MBP1977198.1 16S rRNA G966 N2-methylase RsmD [Cohnella thailandensis]
MIVTTMEKPPAEVIERAKGLAEELSSRYVPRRRETIRGLERAKADAHDGVLVVGPQELRFVHGEEPPLFFHPSMALIRVKRLREGDTDSLLRAARPSPGDVVLDGTAGLASDALVLSYAVGESGRVIALEASKVLHTVVREGLRTYDTGMDDVNRAMRRIEAVHAEHLAYLKALPDRSVDIVFFDPMFSRPVMESTSILPLRTVARDERLTPETVSEALRVARKRVVLKEHRDSKEFGRLGFAKSRRTASSVAYGVMEVNDVK